MSARGGYPAVPVAGRAGAALPRLLAIAALPAEVLALSLRFDTGTIAAESAAWARVLGSAPAAVNVALAAAAALVLALGPRWWSRPDLLRGRVAWRWLAAHLVLAALLAWLTAGLLGEPDARAIAGPAVLALWAAVGAATAVTWLLALAPAARWVALVRTQRTAWLLAAGAGLAAWLAGLLAQALWRPLAQGTFWLSHQALAALYPTVVYEPGGRILGTPRFTVEIAPQCSGYEGIGLVTVFLALYLWLFRREVRLPRALVLFPLGALAIWLANVARITALIAIGSSWSPAVAAGGFHSQAGWITFVLVALGLVGAAHRVPGLRRPTERTVAAGGAILAGALLAPFLALMAVVIVTGAFTAGFDALYPLRVLATGAALWWFRDVYRGWDWRPDHVSIAIGGGVYLVWLALVPGGGAGGTQPPPGLVALPAGWAAPWLAFRVVGSVVTVPLAEELAFRGYLLRKLVSRDFERVAPGTFTWTSFAASSVVFGLLHGSWLAGTAAGMGYALALYRRARIADAVWAHATTNALIAAHVLVLGGWHLWG